MREQSHRRIIRGVSCFDLVLSRDANGETGAFEAGHNLPFDCRRVFTIQVTKGRLDRGGHANSCDELIVAVQGSVLVRVDNGMEQGEVRLTSSQQAVCIRAGVLINLCEFAPGTLLTVCASKPYAETQHFEAPQPQLIAASP